LHSGSCTSSAWSRLAFIFLYILLNTLSSVIPRQLVHLFLLLRVCYAPPRRYFPSGPALVGNHRQSTSALSGHGLPCTHWLSFLARPRVRQVLRCS
jgi:hypothetical protein